MNFNNNTHSYVVLFVAGYKIEGKITIIFNITEKRKAEYS